MGDLVSIVDELEVTVDKLNDKMETLKIAINDLDDTLTGNIAKLRTKIEYQQNSVKVLDRVTNEVGHLFDNSPLDVRVFATTLEASYPEPYRDHGYLLRSQESFSIPPNEEEYVYDLNIRFEIPYNLNVSIRNVPNNRVTVKDEVFKSDVTGPIVLRLKNNSDVKLDIITGEPLAEMCIKKN